LYATRNAAEAVLARSYPGGVTKTPDIRGLRKAMAAVHPDRGGTAEAFIAARERYERALWAAS
jgi:hypothetical protein